MKRLPAAVVLVAAGIALVVAGGAFLLLRDSDEEDGALATMSARERPVEIPLPERVGMPNGPLLTGEAFLIGERPGFRFLRLPREDGSSCFAKAEFRSEEWQLIDWTCETGFQRFPDREQPVMALSRLQILPGTQFIVYDTISGFAADGVKRIAVVDAQGRVVPMADVVGNIFYSEGPSDRVTGLAALDEAGEVIWRSAAIQPPDE
jgi:hypothetical protein